MLQPRNIEEILEEIKKYGIDIEAFQEMRWKRGNEIYKKNLMLNWCRNTRTTWNWF